MTMEQPPDKPERDWDSSVEERVGAMLDDIIGYAAWEHKRKVVGVEVDVYIHDSAIVIQCDGDYWHAHPEYWNDLYDQQKENFIRDARQEHLIEEEHGFHVIRIWEEHVNDCPEKVRDRLKDVLLKDEIPDRRYLIPASDSPE